MNIVQKALEYAEKNFGVIPTHSIIGDYCTCGQRIDSEKCSAGKHPASAHGYQDATTDSDIITQWWINKPWANVAIPTHGRRYFVLDCDPRHGGDDTVAKYIAEHGAMPVTPTVRTGGGGTQWYFMYPEGITIKSRSDVAKGIDVRGDGGYVVAPPSRHKSGNRYEWIHDLDTPLAEAPQWVLDLTSDPKTRTTTTSSSSSPTPPQGAFVIAHDPDFKTHPGAFEGGRNDTLLRLIGTHFAKGDDIETIHDLAYEWADRCTPPIPYKDVDKRIRAIARKREDAGEDGDEQTNSDDAGSLLVSSFLRETIKPDLQPETGSLLVSSYSSQPENTPNSPTGSKTLPLLPTLLAEPLKDNVPVPNGTRIAQNLITTGFRLLGLATQESDPLGW